MSYLIFGLGLLLAICGAASISFGYGIINVERGWASVIGGAAALSGGVVTMALAMILHSLSRLRAFLKAERDARLTAVVPPWEADPAIAAYVEPGAVAPQAAAIEPLVEPAMAEAAAEAEVPAVVVAAPAVQARATLAPIAQPSIEDVRRVVAETIKRKPPEPREEIEERRFVKDEPTPAQMAAPLAEAPAEAPARRRAAPLSFGLPRAVDLKDIAPQHFGGQTAFFPGRPVTEADRGLSPGLPGGPGAERADAAATTAPAEAPKPAPPHHGEGGSTVIGRYESEGTTYVMYADGSIEARSDRGAFHFNSMAELKAFMDTQAHGDA